MNNEADKGREFMEKETNKDLMHYGVKGMKWGVRKDPYSGYNRIKKGGLENARTGDRNGVIPKGAEKGSETLTKAITKKSDDGGKFKNLKVGVSGSRPNDTNDTIKAIKEKAKELKKETKRVSKSEQIQKRKEELAERRANNKWEQLKVSAEKKPKPKEKRPEDMTDKELMDANRRLQQEQQYRSLMKLKKQANKSSGRRFVEKVLIGAALSLASQYLRAGGTKLIDKGYDYVKNLMNFDDVNFDFDLSDVSGLEDLL